jgi:hypothetical protein
VIWREPPEESVDLYPGLTVWDSRVSGSITVGQTRLPLWAFAWSAVVEGWDNVERGWEPSRYGMSQDDFAGFVTDLLEARGEFARLLLVLADAERMQDVGGHRRAWWQTKRHRKRVADQLRRCLAALEDRS